MSRVAMLSVHGCPLARLGTREAGGMQLYVRALSRELGRRGVGVDVYTRRVDPALPTVVPFGSNARVIHLDAGEKSQVDKSTVFDLLPEFVCNLQRFRRAEGIDYDYIHSHYWLSGWVGNLLAPRWNVPHIAMFHTLGRLKNRALGENTESEARSDVEARIVAAVDRVIASSEHERQALVDLYGARRDRVEVIPCGVDLGLFRPGDRDLARRRLGLTGEVILFVGRMDPIKGLDLLLQAVALLKDRPTMRLVVVGGSGAEDEMARDQALVARLGIENQVDFRGSVEQEDLPFYYQAADVCVIPSHYESFGLVAIESLACGTPVIGSMVGGLPTVIRDGDNGLLVPWRHPSEFAERIDTLLSDGPLREALSSRARPSVLKYGWGAVAQRIMSTYQDVTLARQPAMASQDRQ
ncbi:MAG TPA: glycosyltransferase [Chloroflexota bacterium]|nr:glycosyltransferase [Chloroflexota bacterium]